MSSLNSNGPIRAAQYLRMSSDNQRYSTENQQNAIAEYAQQHDYDIVATYIDAGKSGLSLKGRGALKQLLGDALAAQRTFDAILVLDVSRWGRFQNPDQAAHYEFLCRQAGVRVVYCGESFGEDVALPATIMKHLVRVMAGEYSRDLSVKMSRAHRQQAQLGFRQGGRLIYGFRRLLVDPARNPRQILNSGQRKAVSSDKVIVIPGPPEELEVIRRIFRLYVRHQLTITEIAKRLAEAGIKDHGGKPLGISTIGHVLSNELCIGQMTYNVTTKRLQGLSIKNPEQLWTRFSAFEPIVPARLFRKAQVRRSQLATPHWNKESITDSLRSLRAQKGRLTQVLLNETEGAPSAETVVNHFGSLRAAYAAIGYEPPVRLPFGMNGKFWSKKEVLRGLQKLYTAQGRITNRLIDSFPHLPSAVHIRRHFGSLPEAMRQADLPILSHSQIQLRSWRRRRAAGCDEYYLGVRWTDAKLLRALRRLHKQYGFISGNLLDHNGGTPSKYHFIRRFGSLTKARVLAKLPTQTHSQIMLAAWKRKKEGRIIRRQRRHPGQRPGLHYRSDDILLGLKRLAKRVGMVSARLIDEDPNLPSWATVALHFGSLSAAYQLAGLIRLDGKPVRFGLPPRR
jgi:DNA invertase Pin-like site-specific DNA recombinase